MGRKGRGRALRWRYVNRMMPAQSRVLPTKGSSHVTPSARPFNLRRRRRVQGDARLRRSSLNSVYDGAGSYARWLPEGGASESIGSGRAYACVREVGALIGLREAAQRCHRRRRAGAAEVACWDARAVWSAPPARPPV